jgi:hypothetical protein
MSMNEHLVDLFATQARETIVRRVTIGVGYTSVETESKLYGPGMGLSYTWLPEGTGCHVVKDYTDWEGRSADLLLRKISGNDTIDRTLAVACINALNYPHASILPEEQDNDHIYNVLDIKTGDRIVMVGYFKPLIEPLRSRGATVEVFDKHHGIGNQFRLPEDIERGAKGYIISATALINNSLETILSRIPTGAKAVVLGPSTPLIAELFRLYPVTLLAGTVPVKFSSIERAVRHGTGAPVIRKYGKKVSMRM